MIRGTNYYSLFIIFILHSVTRQSSGKHRKAPPPPQSRSAKPRPAPKPRLPMCKTLYTYEPQEADELSFAEGEMIEIVNEGMYSRFSITPTSITRYSP